MNKLSIADALLFILGAVFGLCLGYTISVVVRYVKMNQKCEFKMLKGGKDDQ